MSSVILQVIAMDIIFSFDSILTAVGLVDNLLVMILAVIIAMVVMLIFAKSVSDFVNANPTIKMLALAFLLLIGTVLIAEGFGQKISKGYIYAAMIFSVFVEVLNIGVRRKKQHAVPVRLREPVTEV